MHVYVHMLTQKCGMNFSLNVLFLFLPLDICVPFIRACLRVYYAQCFQSMGINSLDQGT